MHILLALIILFLTSINLNASDLAKEKRWSTQVVDSLMDGDAVWLNDGKTDFLSLYMESEIPQNKAVIIMHGTGVHPNWSQVIQPLRIGLTEKNWNTLSIQMPILVNEAKYIDYAPLYDGVTPRLNAAIDFLKKSGTKEIVLIAHSMGSTMAAYSLSTLNKQQQANLKGFIAIGMTGYGKDPRMNGATSLEKIEIPVLDLYGLDDLKGIRESANIRKIAATKAKNMKYSQIQIKGNHFYDGQDELLITTVAKWLNSLSK